MAKKELTIPERCRILLEGERLPSKLITSVEEAEKLGRKKNYRRKPFAMVTLRRMELVDPKTKEHNYNAIVRNVPLYNFADLGLAHIVTVGRACECDLRPFTESLCPPYSKRTADDVLRDLHTDRVPTDFEVSKLQGIVYLDRHGQMIYQDRSRLGSVVNDELIVMGSRYNWDEYITDHIGIGQQKVVKMRENPNAKLEKTRLVTIERKQSMFRLHWVPYDMFPRPKRKGML